MEKGVDKWLLEAEKGASRQTRQGADTFWPGKWGHISSRQAQSYPNSSIHENITSNITY